MDPAFTFVRFQSHNNDIELEDQQHRDSSGLYSLSHGTASLGQGQGPRPTSLRGTGPGGFGSSSAATPTFFKSVTQTIVSHSPSLASSIRSALSSATPSSIASSLRTSHSGSLFPISPLSGTNGIGSGTGPESSNQDGTDENEEGGERPNFDNPIFELYHRKEEAGEEEDGH